MYCFIYENKKHSYHMNAQTPLRGKTIAVFLFLLSFYTISLLCCCCFVFKYISLQFFSVYLFSVTAVIERFIYLFFVVVVLSCILLINSHIVRSVQFSYYFFKFFLVLKIKKFDIRTCYGIYRCKKTLLL